MPSKLLFVAAASLAFGIANAQSLPIPGKPRIGLRVSFGQWNSTVLGGGLDVTIKIPLVPIPELRFDAEAWTNLDEGGNGTAISVLGMKRFVLVYAGLGPAFYSTSRDGDGRNGIGAKILIGTDLPMSNLYLEGSVIIGPSPMPVMVSLGFKF
jgi:hypothetical protein